MGAATPVLPRLCARDFHLGEVRLPTRAAARSRALCRRAVAAEAADIDCEPDAARRRRAPPAREFARPPAEVFLRDAGQAVPPDLRALREPFRPVLRTVQEVPCQSHAHRLWLRRLPHPARPPCATEDHRAGWG